MPSIRGALDRIMPSNPFRKQANAKDIRKIQRAFKKTLSKEEQAILKTLKPEDTVILRTHATKLKIVEKLGIFRLIEFLQGKKFIGSPIDWIANQLDKTVAINVMKTLDLGQQLQQSADKEVAAVIFKQGRFSVKTALGSMKKLIEAFSPQAAEYIKQIDKKRIVQLMFKV